MIKTLVDHPILLVFVVLAIGAALGAVRIRGVSLGPAGALFAGLALSAIDKRLAIPEIVGTIGLALFTYTIGLASGPAFFSSFRSQLRTIAVVATLLVCGMFVARGMGSLFSLSSGTSAGLFAGSFTNTPALAAAREALKGATNTAPVVGYSVAYPIGVCGMLLAAWWALRMGVKRPNDDDRAAPAELGTVTLRVREGLHVPFTELSDRFAASAVFARLERDGQQMVPDATITVSAGDLLSVTAPAETIVEVTELLGERADHQLAHDRSQLDFRRIVVSSRDVTGRKLGDIDLYGKFGAIATRVRRGDVDLLARDDVVLLPGDRLRVVAPRRRLSEVAKHLGDSERGLAELDALGFMLGIAAGLALALIRIPLGGAHFSLGNAGGPLVVGLILGRLERTGPIVWQPPYGAGLAVRQLGTILFLGQVGSSSGGALKTAMSSPQGLKLLAGSVVVVGVIGVALLLAGKWMGLGGARMAGVVAGFETQPAVLAFASGQTADDRVSTAYALVFPVAMLAKIILAQVLALW